MPLKRALPIVRYSENQGYVTYLILFLIPVPGTYSPQDQTKQFTANTPEEPIFPFSKGNFCKLCLILWKTLCTPHHHHCIHGKSGQAEVSKFLMVINCVVMTGYIGPPLPLGLFGGIRLGK